MQLSFIISSPLFSLSPHLLWRARNIKSVIFYTSWLAGWIDGDTSHFYPISLSLELTTFKFCIQSGCNTRWSEWWWSLLSCIVVRLFGWLVLHFFFKSSRNIRIWVSRYMTSMLSVWIRVVHKYWIWVMELRSTGSFAGSQDQPDLLWVIIASAYWDGDI